MNAWNSAGEPDLVFGVPDGWAQVPALALTWFAAERQNTPADAPILQNTRILAAFEHPGAGGAISLRYAYCGDNAILVLYEAWLLKGGGTGSAPA